MKSQDITKRFFQIFFLVLLLSFSSLSFSKANWACEDENYTDQELSEEPNSYLLLTAKAQCLFKRGATNDALSFLERAINNKGVFSAHLLATYIETDGTYEPINDGVRESEIIDSAIQARHKVLDVIGHIPNYPETSIDYIRLEQEFHIYINTTFSAARLYFNRYFYQLVNHNSQMLASSPTFDTSPETSAKSLSVTFLPSVSGDPVFSLDGLKQAAQVCINTPYIKYWNRKKYDGYIKACRLLETFEQEVRNLEHQRMTISKTCKNFIKVPKEDKDCKEYIRVSREIMKKRGEVIRGIKELGAEVKHL